MSRALVPIVGVVAWLLWLPLQAQLNDVTNHAGFSGQSTKFDFSGPLEGADASTILSDWGVTFGKGDSGSAVVSVTQALGFVNNHVLHVHPSGSSADFPLVLNFRYPVSKIGLVLSNGTDLTQFTITALDEVGFLIGQLNRQGLASPKLIEMSTSHFLGISKLVIDYGTADGGEEIDDLQIEYLDRPPFVTYIAQVGNGAIPGVGNLVTTIIVSNLSNSTGQGEIQFFSSGGDPLNLQIAGVTASKFPLTLPPFSSRTFTTAGSNLAVGYARIQSTTPIEGTGVFRIAAANGSIVTEAGVGSAKGTSASVGVVEKVLSGTFDSGIALVNTSDEEITVVLEVYDQSGALVRGGNSLFNLGPKEHNAQFLSQLFPSLAATDFEGTIRVLSDRPVATVILRTVNGLVLSSLPVGSTEK